MNEALALAAKASKRWARTLELLKQAEAEEREQVLDEDDHRDREKNGVRLVRSFRGHWHTPDFDCRMYCRLITDDDTEYTLAAWNKNRGPLTFAPTVICDERNPR